VKPYLARAPGMEQRVIHADDIEDAARRFASAHCMADPAPSVFEVAVDPAPTRAMPRWQKREASSVLTIRAPDADSERGISYWSGIAPDGAPWATPASEAARLAGYTTPGWYFTDETEANIHGPYRSPSEAHMGQTAYCLYELRTDATADAFQETLELIAGHRIVEEGDAVSYFEALSMACLLRARELRAKAEASGGLVG
jgi:hypothetical protein